MMTLSDLSESCIKKSKPMKSFLYPFFEYVHPRDMIVLAISGGVDSMVLLDLVRKAHSKDYMIVAHFDHMLR